MLLNNILDKVVTMFCRPNLEIQKLLAMTIFRAVSVYLLPFSSNVSDVAIFLSNCKQTSLYSFIPLVVEESQRNHACSRWRSQSSTLLSEKKNNLKHRNLNRKWIEKKKKSGAWHHQSFRLNSKLSSSISS